MTVTINSPTFGWSAPLTLTVGEGQSVELTNASGINVTTSMTTEECDIMAAENTMWYVPNKSETSISFTVKLFNAGVDAFATQVSPFMTALLAGTSVSMTIDGVSGKFICTKCDANRESGKVVSYSIELKPTINIAP